MGYVSLFLFMTGDGTAFNKSPQTTISKSYFHLPRKRRRKRQVKQSLYLVLGNRSKANDFSDGDEEPQWAPMPAEISGKKPKEGPPKKKPTKFGKSFFPFFSA